MGRRRQCAGRPAWRAVGDGAPGGDGSAVREPAAPRLECGVLAATRPPPDCARRRAGAEGRARRRADPSAGLVRARPERRPPGGGRVQRLDASGDAAGGWRLGARPAARAGRLPLLVRYGRWAVVRARAVPRPHGRRHGRPRGRDGGVVSEPRQAHAALAALGDAELIERVLAGERECFQPLVQRYQESLYRVACALVLDPDAAADIVQDAFVRAYANLARCHDRRRFRFWLLATLRNRGLDYLKE